MTRPVAHSGAARAALLLGALVAPPLAAQPTSSAGPAPAVAPALLAGLTWRSIGPARGGRVTAVTGVATEPHTFYLGATGGGVWKTENAGQSWRNVSDGFFGEGSIGAVEVAPSDPRVVYVGTGSDGLRSNVSPGRGVYRSADAGRTWAHVGLRAAGQIGAVRADPRDPNTAYVAALGNAFAPNAERGVYKTTDGGRTWARVLFLSDSTGAVDVELQPGNPDVVYASMWRAERKPWTITSGAREGGVYRSTDAGRTWARLGGGLPDGLFGKSNLAVTAASPRRVYALVEAKPGAGLYRSDDAGDTWRLVNAQPSLVTRPFYYTTLAGDPTNADVVYAGAEDFFKSTDGGRTFARFDTPHGDNHDLWVNPRDGRVLIQANDGGANVSLDGGRTWSTQYNQPTGEIYNVALDDQVPYRVYGAQQDQGGTLIVQSLPATSSPPDDPLQGWTKGPGCETGPVMPHPTQPDTVYGACKGQFSRASMRTGQERQFWTGAQSLYGQPNAALRYRFQRVSPMATSPHDPRAVYYGSQFVHKSTDGGETWTTISPDLTVNDPRYRTTISGGPVTIDVTGEEMYATLYSIRESPVARGVIWAGANDGPVSVTRDGGATWTRVTPPALPPGGRVQTVEPSPHRAGSAYVAVLRYQLGDPRPYLYATTDYGRTWRLLTPGDNGIPADEPTRVVREDPARPGLLYAGTEYGLYVSVDDGRRWQPLMNGLPHVPVTDLAVHRRGDLVASTQGRAFWVLDDLAPLRELADPALRSALGTPGDPGRGPAHLFAPRPGLRLRYRAGFGGEESSRASAADPQYPPAGAMIDYWVAPGAATPGSVLALEVRDAAGRLVRRYTSVGSGERTAPVALNMRRPAVETLGTPRLDASPGAHRVVWDFAHHGPLDPGSARSGRNGPMAAPGRYTVRLAWEDTAGAVGWSAERPLVVEADPRAVRDGMTPARFAAQLAHNLRARDLVTDVNAVVARVRAARRAAAGDTAALGTLERALVAEAVRYGRPGLQTQVQYLYGAAAGADQPVGADVLARYAELRRAVDARRREADRILGQSRTTAAAP